MSDTSVSGPNIGSTRIGSDAQPLYGEDRRTLRAAASRVVSQVWFLGWRASVEGSPPSRRLRRIGEATPLPWRTTHRGPGELDTQKHDTPEKCLVLSEWCEMHPIADTSANHTCAIPSGANAALIVDAANALPRLLDACTALRSLAGAANAFLLAPKVAQRENRLRKALEGAREALK